MIEAESRLVRQALEGSERAFKTILESNYTLTCSVVRGIMGPTIDVEDVVQEVFIKVFRALPDFRGDSRLSTWIYRIARNEALNARSRRRERTVPIEDCEDLRAEAGNPETSLRRTMAAEHLERLMQRLDEPERLALELRYAGEKTYEEIAEIMGIPLGTVKTHIHRSKLSLKRMMTRSGAASIEKGRGES